MASKPRHPGITGSPGKWQSKKPEARTNIQLADDMALAIFAAVHADPCDAVHHKHGRCWQLRIAWADIAPFARFEQLFFCVGRLRSMKIVWVGQVNKTLVIGRWAVEHQSTAHSVLAVRM